MEPRFWSERRTTGTREIILGWIAAVFLRLYCATWRVDFGGMKRFEDLLAEEKRVLLAFWHGKYLPLFAVLRGRKGCVFTSDSFRGRVIREICHHFGYTCFLVAQGHRADTLNIMEELLVSWNLVALAVDGPLGPYHKVKSGAIRLGAALGFVIAPVTTASRRKHVIAGRWDRMELPALFTRVALVVGEPLKIPTSLTHDDQSCWEKRLADALVAADGKAEQMVSNR